MGYNSKILNKQPLSADFVSPAQQVLDAALFSIQADFNNGSSVQFTAHIETSADAYDNAPGFVPDHFDPYPNSAVTFTEAGTFTWNIYDAGFVWTRLVITATDPGNDGTLSARINVKGPI